MVGKVCKDRKVMHQKLSCFAKATKHFDNMTAGLMRELGKVKSLDQKDRKNAACCILEQFNEKLGNVSIGCSPEEWDFFELIIHPLLIDLPEAMCDWISSASSEEDSKSSNEKDHCEGMPPMSASPGNGSSVSLIPFMLQLMSE